MKCYHCEKEGVFAYHSGRIMHMLCALHANDAQQILAPLPTVNKCEHGIYMHCPCEQCHREAVGAAASLVGGLNLDDTDRRFFVHETGPLGEDDVAERDPNGIDQHTLGAKLDAGKLKAALVMGDFARALTEVIRVGTFGANKYTDHGWLHVDDGFNRYTDAMQRHYLKEITEGPLDQDSGITHAGHLAWNALARLELMLREKS